MAPRTPQFKPTSLNITGGNVMVSTSVVGLIIAIVWQGSSLKNSFENRMTLIEGQLKSMNENRWDLPRQREFHAQVWRDNPTIKLDSSAPDIIRNRIP